MRVGDATILHHDEPYLIYTVWESQDELPQVCVKFDEDGPLHLIPLGAARIRRMLAEFASLNRRKPQEGKP